jgi:uncharacterized membrane protein
MRGNETIEFNRMPMHRGMVGGQQQWDAGMAVELIVRLALVALFVWAVVMLVTYVVKYLNAKSGIGAESAEDIAKRRYASGEITKAEYEQLKKDLK